MKASKCRFCGETVSKPRREDRRLTVHDLGGEADHSFQVSGNVMDALEAFRSSEFGAEGALSAKGKKTDEPTPSNAMDFTPNFDISISSNRPSAFRVQKKNQGPDWQRIAIIVGVLLLALVIGAFAAIKIRAYLNRSIPVPPVINDNTALDTLHDGHPITALRQAVDALKGANTDFNRAAADQVRDAVAKQVRITLKMGPWSIDNIANAMQLVDEAMRIDESSDVIRGLKAEVEEENYAYSKMTIAHIDPVNNTVVLKIIYPDKPIEVQQVTAIATPEGTPPTLVRNRFIVRKVTSDYVLLEDTKRQTPAKQNLAIKLYLDGTVRVVP